MRRMRTFVVAALLVAFAPPAHAQIVLSRSVVGTGGGVVSDGTTRSASTLGQPVIGVSADGDSRICHGFWCGGVLSIVGVDDRPAGGPTRPERLAFGVPMPNPSRGRVQFDLALPARAAVRMAVIDVSGRQVALAHDERLEAGRYRIAWNGRDAGGRAISAGVYFARLEVDGRFEGRRTIVVVP